MNRADNPGRRDLYPSLGATGLFVFAAQIKCSPDDPPAAPSGPQSRRHARELHFYRSDKSPFARRNGERDHSPELLSAALRLRPLTAPKSSPLIRVQPHLPIRESLDAPTSPSDERLKDRLHRALPRPFPARPRIR